MTDRPPAEVPPAAAAMQIATGYFAARALHVAVSLGIPDRLAAGPQSAAALAAATGAQADMLFRLLRGLAACGVLEHLGEDRFGLTPIGDALRADAPDSARAGVLMFHHPTFWRSWEALEETVRTGRPGFEQVFGRPFFEHMAATPDAAALYDGGMTGLSAPIVRAVVAAYDFTPFSTIVDIAGGHGSLLAAILEAAPAARGVLKDLPHVAAVAEGRLAARGLGARARVEGGSMFEGVPAGGDCYLMKWILHDWDDAACTRVLGHIAGAMAPGGRFLAVDRVLPARMTASAANRTAAMADLIMMIHLSGRERTEAEFRTLLAGAGLSLARIIPTASPLSIIEAVRA